MANSVHSSDAPERAMELRSTGNGRLAGTHELPRARSAHVDGDKVIVNGSIPADPTLMRDREHHLHIGDRVVRPEKPQQTTDIDVHDGDHHVYVHIDEHPGNGLLAQQRSVRCWPSSGTSGASPEKAKALQSQPSPQVGVYTDFNRLPVSSVLEPHLIYQKIAKTGAKKSQISSSFQHLWTVLIQALLAGIYIGLGDVLLLSVGAQLFGIKKTDPGLAKLFVGSFGLPWGLTMVVLMGAELFTSNTSYLPTAFYEGKATLRGWATSWSISYFGNLAGALLLAIVIKGANLFEGEMVEEAVQAVAEHKVEAGWGSVVLRGIMCNWCVNLAVWMASSAQDVASKFIVILLPISAFVTIGFEHSVANMFLIPFGMMMGADITVGDFLWRNLIPATLGNIVSGWLVMSTVYSLLYGSLAGRLRLSNGIVEPKDK